MKTISSIAVSLLFVSMMPLSVAAQQKSTPKPPPEHPDAQVIYLANPSFEDFPHKGLEGGPGPRGWYDCGKPGETPPDIQPGFFNVNLAANEGSTFLGMVVRDNETWEAVGQRLSEPLTVGKTYEFSIFLRRADAYMSPTKSSAGNEVSFATPVKFRVWGGNGFCDHAELLYETPLVVNSDRWLSYGMVFKPKNNYNFILMEAYYKTPVLFPYNGNVLVDNASPIREVIEKKKQPPIVQGPKKPNPTTPPVSGKQTAKTTPQTPSTQPLQANPVTDIAKADPSKLKKGDILALPNLYFDADKYDIKQECIPTLNSLLDFLQKNGAMKVEIAGHTNNRLNDDIANRLSNNRAKAVADWLIQRGVPSSRVLFKGYGKTQPLVPNTDEEGRKKNQRVEIKILSVTG